MLTKTREKAQELVREVTRPLAQLVLLSLLLAVTALFVALSGSAK